MRVLLLSTYELGHQPLGLARPVVDLWRPATRPAARISPSTTWTRLR